MTQPPRDPALVDARSHELMDAAILLRMARDKIDPYIDEPALGNVVDTLINASIKLSLSVYIDPKPPNARPTCYRCRHPIDSGEPTVLLTSDPPHLAHARCP